MPNKINGSSRKIFLAGGYSALLIGFLVIGVLPYLRDMRSARGEIAQAQEEIDARQLRTRQLQDIVGVVKEIKAETRDYDRLVPPNQDLGSFLKELYKQLDESGMSDISVHNMPPTPLGRSEKLPIEVKGKGTYAQFHMFLERLEKLPRLASVGRLSVDADAEMKGDVDVQLMLFIYNAKAGS